MTKVIQVEESVEVEGRERLMDYSLRGEKNPYFSWLIKSTGKRTLVQDHSILPHSTQGRIDVSQDPATCFSGRTVAVEVLHYHHLEFSAAEKTNVSRRIHTLISV